MDKDVVSCYAENAERFLAPVQLHPFLGEGHMESSPIGVIFCVEPRNFPYYGLARVVASSHAPMLSQPQAVADLVIRAARDGAAR
jgi:hypothetical protein